MSGRENTTGYEDATGLCHHALLQGSRKGLSPHLLNRSQSPAWSSYARKKHEGEILSSLQED